MQFEPMDWFHDTRYSPRPGVVTSTVARGADEITWPSERICAQSAMWPAIDFGSSALAVTRSSRSLLLVTAPLRS